MNDSPPLERNREQTRGRILTAVGAVLAREGFAGIGINAVAREAGVDKVLIYRYFGGLSELLKEWGGSGRFWPSLDELLGDDPEAILCLPPAKRYSRFMDHFIDSLRARPLTLEILATEVVEHNELTAILEVEREAWGQRATEVLGGREFIEHPELRGLTNLLICGAQYLMIRSRNLKIFGGIDIQSDAGWDELKASVRAMAERLFKASGGG